MTNDELIEGVATTIENELRLSTLDAIDNKELTEPVTYSLAKAVIEHLAPMMCSVVAYMWHKDQCDLTTSFTKDCTCNYHQALAALPPVFKEGV